MMYYRNTIQIPIFILEKWHILLNRSNIISLLLFIRQTVDWLNSYTGRRKELDRFTQSQFVLGTGLTSRMVSKLINSLLDMKL